MNFSQLTEIEPELQNLANRIERFSRSKNRQRQHITEDWYRRFKPTMVKLVGFYARHPKLRTIECYNFTYNYLYRLLVRPFLVKIKTLPGEVHGPAWDHSGEMRYRRKSEFKDRIEDAIDAGVDGTDIIEWQLRSRTSMQTQNPVEEMTSPALQEKFGLTKKELRWFHLIDKIRGEGLTLKQVAQREHIKSETLRKNIAKIRKKLGKRLKGGWVEPP